MKTHDTDTSNFVDRNIEMGFDFVRESLDDSTLLDSNPNDAAVVHVLDDDPELAEHNLEIAMETVRRGFDVYIRRSSPRR